MIVAIGRIPTTRLTYPTREATNSGKPPHNTLKFYSPCLDANCLVIVN